jgi:hypothetical protein
MGNFNNKKRTEPNKCEQPPPNPKPIPVPEPTPEPKPIPVPESNGSFNRLS